MKFVPLKKRTEKLKEMGVDNFSRENIQNEKSNYEYLRI